MCSRSTWTQRVNMSSSEAPTACCRVLARGLDDASVLMGSPQETVSLSLVRRDLPQAPPHVHADLADPYVEFKSLYRSIGLRIERDGPDAGELEKRDAVGGRESWITRNRAPARGGSTGAP
jgi:hypothetical protein